MAVITWCGMLTQVVIECIIAGLLKNLVSDVLLMEITLTLELNEHKHLVLFYFTWKMLSPFKPRDRKIYILLALTYII